MFGRPLLGYVVTKSIFGTAGYDVSVAGCTCYLFNVLFSLRNVSFLLLVFIGVMVWCDLPGLDFG